MRESVRVCVHVRVCVGASVSVRGSQREFVRIREKERERDWEGGDLYQTATFRSAEQKTTVSPLVFTSPLSFRMTCPG